MSRHRLLLILLCLAAPATVPLHAVEEGDRLLRLGYQSDVTGARREYFVYLPVGYAEGAGRDWPVILFLHGNGQRGDGLDDLDYVLRHGPLAEAWLHKRPLPFVMISPQLPLFGELEAIEDRKSHERPSRPETGTRERNYGYPSEKPIEPNHTAEGPRAPYSSQSIAAGEKTLPKNWSVLHGELIQILDAVQERFDTDRDRVYLTGVSLGGFGTFSLGAAHPERFAALAPIVGAAMPGAAAKLAEARIPIWLFGGGKDSVVDPGWLYETAIDLEAAGHPNLRFTVHEDMDHDAWKRVYEGQDLFDWFLRFDSRSRPGPEKGLD